MRKGASDIVVLSFCSVIVSCPEKLQFCPFSFVFVGPLIQTDSDEPRLKEYHRYFDMSIERKSIAYAEAY